MIGDPPSPDLVAGAAAGRPFGLTLSLPDVDGLRAIVGVEVGATAAAGAPTPAPVGPADPGSKCRRGRHVLRSIPLGLPLCRSRDATEVLDGHGRWIVGIGQRIVGEGQCCTEQPPVSVAPVMPRGGGVTLNAL